MPTSTLEQPVAQAEPEPSLDRPDASLPFGTDVVVEPLMPAAQTRCFAGFRLTTILLVAIIGALLAWNAWMTREIFGLRRHRIVSVSLASIITDFVHDQSRQQATPDEAAVRTRVYLAATQKALIELAKNGTPVVASEAVLGNSVPDDTAAVKSAVAKALAAPADQH